jgi:hypothetical protein
MKLGQLFILVALLVSGGPFATAAEDENVNVVALDMGEVWQGSTIEPCVYLKNTSSTSTRVRQVQAPQASTHPLDLILGPGEETVQYLPQIKTSHFVGPIEKRVLLLVDPPVVLAVGLLESCEEL